MKTRLRRNDFPGLDCKTWIVAVSLLYCSFVSEARADQTISIIPKPVSLKTNSGTFNLTADTTISTSTETKALGQTLANYLSPSTGFALNTSDAKTNVIRLELNPSLTQLGTE